MNIIGISRGHRFSPNHISNDSAIFNHVMDELRKLGYAPISYTEEEFAQVGMPTKKSFVVNMARSNEVLEKLKEWHANGIRVINSPYGIDNCIRLPMTIKLINEGSPHPISWIVDTSLVDTGVLDYPCWIKRGDSHAIQKEDVSYARNQEEANLILKNFKDRGIRTSVINEHLQGDLVKFYGVLDTDFFYWFYPSPLTHSKFGLEIFNGYTQGFTFNPTILKQYAYQAAKVLDVPIFGGDAIVMEDGEIKLIDFNDWPSFAPCRNVAAEAIACYINHRIREEQ